MGAFSANLQPLASISANLGRLTTTRTSASPLPDAALESLRSMYGALGVYPPEQGDIGYVQFQVDGPVTYEGVTSIQRCTSAAMQSFGGVCESWGVMH